MLDKAYRRWTEYLSEDVAVAEYDDGDVIINYQLRTRPCDGIVLEPHQVNNLVEFTRSDDRASAGEVSLGEDIIDVETTIQYEDGTYLLTQESDEVELSETLMTQIIQALMSWYSSLH